MITRSDVMGGASVHLLDLASGVQRAGHEVTIIVGGDGVFVEQAYLAGLRCISLKALVRDIDLVKDVKCFFELRSTLKSIKPDVVHLHSSKAGIIGRLVAKSLSIPAIFTAHGWAFTEGVSPKRRKLYRVIEKLMARFTSKIIAVSEYDRQLALKLGVGNSQLIDTIHNGMPDNRVIRVVRDSEDVVKIIMVARFERPKDQCALIRALSLLKNLDWELELVGDGPELSSASLLVDKLELSSRISFSGACKNVADRLATSDIFVLISSWEGLPLTILEAMRTGLPVIASSVGGVPEAVQHSQTGMLVGANDEQALVKALSALLMSPKLRHEMGDCGKARFESNFTFNKMLKKTLDVYGEVVHNFK